MFKRIKNGCTASQRHTTTQFSTRGSQETQCWYVLLLFIVRILITSVLLVFIIGVYIITIWKCIFRIGIYIIIIIIGICNNYQYTISGC